MWPKGYGFAPVLIINYYRASILAILFANRVWFLLSCLELGMVLEEVTFSSAKALHKLCLGKLCTCRNGHKFLVRS